MAKGKRGFASMAPDKRSEIARKGGQAAHVKGTAHEYAPQEARVAGRKGGKRVSQDRAYMSAIGSKGGVKRQRKETRDTPQDTLTRQAEGEDFPAEEQSRV
jgi:general stress protein YciG